MNELKTLEARARRLAKKHGYRLEKSRARSPAHPEFGCYRLMDGRTDSIGFGRYRYNLWLMEVLDFLES